ncbi:MAG: trigger factor [Verrucomicrobiales bacterium]|jgi:trigger factor|nr:trigger factor [Verrucomicrobiales bacterium]|tara:strand:- start:6171 stop:7508 length:1338 start_codon:yes stop_codon:yes gene_type:complete
MNITVERLPECKARLSAEIPADTVTDTRKQIVAAYSAQAKVPGFRPGKIPASVIEKRYAVDIEGELKDRLARSAYGEAREKENLAILGIAQVEREQFEADGSYMLAVEVVTEPEVEIADYKEIEVEVQKMEVTDEMIDGYLNNMRKQQAVPKDVDRAAVPTDLVVVDYTATLDGEPLADKLEEQAGPLAKGESHWVDVPEEGEESREFIPGLSKEVEGMSAGDSKTFDAEYAEDFPVEVVAGKTVQYDIKVTQVKERELPTLDDEHAKAMGAESLEELKGKVSEQFKQQQEQARNQIIDNQVLAHLNDEMAFDLPQHIVFNETQRQVNQMVSRGYEQGLSEGEIEENQEDLMKSAETQAKNNVKTMFILEEIAQKEGITASQEEVSQRVMMTAQQQRRPVKKLARELRDNNGFENISQDIVISKTIEFLRSNAKVSEVEAPAEEN